MAGFVRRFAVGRPDGPRSSVWRTWSLKDGTICLGVRSITSKLKVSLHPRERQSGLDKDYHAKLRARGLRLGSARKVWKEGIPIGSTGFTLEFRILFPTSHLQEFITPDRYDPKVIWITPHTNGMATEITVLFGPANEANRFRALDAAGNETQAFLLAQAPINDDRSAYFLYHSAPEPGAFQNQELLRAQVQEAGRQLGIEFLPQHRLFVDFDGPDGVRGACEYSAQLLLNRGALSR
jgi:hypothetical protein